MGSFSVSKSTCCVSKGFDSACCEYPDDAKLGNASSESPGKHEMTGTLFAFKGLLWSDIRCQDL